MINEELLILLCFVVFITVLYNKLKLTVNLMFLASIINVITNFKSWSAEYKNVYEIQFQGLVKVGLYQIILENTVKKELGNNIYFLKNSITNFKSLVIENIKMKLLAVLNKQFNFKAESLFITISKLASFSKSTKVIISQIVANPYNSVFNFLINSNYSNQLKIKKISLI